MFLYAYRSFSSEKKLRKKEKDENEWKTEKIIDSLHLHHAPAVALFLSGTNRTRRKLVEFNYNKRRHKHGLQSGH
jgi:hypothetical protein